MPDKDPLGMNAPDVKQQPTNDPLGMNEVAPAEKKKVIPSVSSGGGSPSQGLSEHKTSGPVFQGGYIGGTYIAASQLPQVNQDELKKFLGVQAQNPLALHDQQPQQVQEIQKLKESGKKIPTKEPVRSGEEVPAAKEYFKTLADQPEDVQKQVMGYVQPDSAIPTIPEVSPKTNELIQSMLNFSPDPISKLIKFAMDKQAIDATNKVPIIGPIATNLTKGIVSGLADTFDQMDGAQKLVYDTVGNLTDVDFGNSPSLFKQYADLIKLSETVKEDTPILGSEDLGKTVKGVGQMVPMLATLEVMPEMKSAFTVYMGVTAGLGAYSDARNNGAEMPEALQAGYKSSMGSAATGLAFTILGYKADELAKIFTTDGTPGIRINPELKGWQDETAPKTLPSENITSPLGYAGTSALANAAGFVGVGKMSAEMEGKNYTNDDLKRDVMLSFALGMPNVQRGVKQYFADRLYARAQQNYWSIDPELMKYDTQQKVYDNIEKFREAAVKLRTEASEIQNEDLSKENKIKKNDKILKLYDELTKSELFFFEALQHPEVEKTEQLHIQHDEMVQKILHILPESKENSLVLSYILENVRRIQDMISMLVMIIH